MQTRGKALVDNNWQLGDDGEDINVDNIEEALETMDRQLEEERREEAEAEAEET